jgi:hypothetical protein
MSTDEDWLGVAEDTDATGFELDNSEELEQNMQEYELFLVAKKSLEIQLAEIQKNLDDCVRRLQVKVGDRKRVRAIGGWTAAWVPKKRKGYSVAAKEWEAFEIRSPF